MPNKPKKKQQISRPKRQKRSNPTLKKIRTIVGDFIWWKSFWRKALTILASFVILLTGTSYGIAQWYIHKHSGSPLTLGTSFIPAYAESFGLNPKETLNAILGDLGMKQVRLVSYWDQIEKTPGVYDFSDLDWQFALANKYGARVSLAIGLRQPRWPECHEPEWAKSMPKNQWESKLYAFMNAVINHYKNNPALADYELENEFFMKVFGRCSDFNRDRLIYEYNMVKRADPGHKVIISRSDNWVGIPIGKPVPDEFAISVYKRVWDATVTHRYFEYPLPAWFYSALAGAEELYSGKNMIIHELQAEPWAPNGLEITQISLAEQFKSMNAQRMKSRIAYGEATGMRTIDLWGAEWWYWLKTVKHDNSVWNVVKEEVARADSQNHYLTQNR